MISFNNLQGVSDFRPNPNAHGSMQKTKNTSQKQDEKINKTLQGVLLNTYIKDNAQRKAELNEITNTLVIPDDFKKHPVLVEQDEKEKTETKKRSLVTSALPYCASALLAAGMALIVSNSYLKSQKLLKPGNVPSGVKLPTVGKNINLKTEEYFAIYMAISEPKSKNILAMLGVFAMAALTFIGKSVVDGTKKVWLKKQEADVKKNFEERVIDVETKSFAGKLDVVRQELVEKTNYFREKLSALPDNAAPQKKDESMIFGQFINFKGKDKTENKEEKKSFKDSPLALIAVSALTLGAVALAGKKIFKNIADGEKIKTEALKKAQDKIRESISSTVDEFNKASEEAKRTELLSKIKEKLLSLGAETDEVKNTFEKAGFKDDALKGLVEEVDKSIGEMKFGEKFYVQADPAMGGREGTQFYIYIDQAKGYIYDVITHPENKFARYLFSAITATGAAGYILKESFDALKDAAVIKENSNTELDLQKRLVETEVRNFKSKKQSAIEPMMIEFDTKLKEGRPKEELQTMAENILLEIKNGPPFVYA